MTSHQGFVVHLAKEAFKFSCSHFTILAPNQAERLHGHNYQLRMDVGLSDLDPQLGLAFDFNQVKPEIKRLCDQFDERILLPLRSPFLKIRTESTEVHVEFGKKRYVFPLEDTLCLPITNITSEELARHSGQELAAAIKDLPRWTYLCVHIEETRGQSVSYHLPRST